MGGEEDAYRQTGFDCWARLESRQTAQEDSWARFEGRPGFDWGEIGEQGGIQLGTEIGRHGYTWSPDITLSKIGRQLRERETAAMERAERERSDGRREGEREVLCDRSSNVEKISGPPIAISLFLFFLKLKGM